jgi:UDP-glucose 4-epimerase
VNTTLDVLEYVRTCSPQTTLVYPSSAAVYGAARNIPIGEESPLNPFSPYGAHKKIVEDLCRSYGQNFGLSIAIVRVFSAYGRELRKQLLWDACQKVRHGQCSFDGTGRETRDWIDAEDVARLLVLAADHASQDVPIVNGATGIEVSTSEILSTLFEALGGEMIPEFSGVSRPGDPERLVGDTTRAQAWGWSPIWDWRRGVSNYAEWFKESCW